jgi:putative oxidoreductase
MCWPKNKVQTVLTVLLTLAFLMSGIMKLMGLEMVKEGFEGWGYPIFFMYIIGLCEVAGAIGLWLRRFSFAAKVCFIILMTGAVLTHLVFDSFQEAMAPIILIILTAVALALHRRERDTNDDLMPA